MNSRPSFLDLIGLGVETVEEVNSSSTIIRRCSSGFYTRQTNTYEEPSFLQDERTKDVVLLDGNRNKTAEAYIHENGIEERLE